MDLVISPLAQSCSWLMRMSRVCQRAETIQTCTIELWSITKSLFPAHIGVHFIDLGLPGKPKVVHKRNQPSAYKQCVKEHQRTEVPATSNKLVFPGLPRLRKWLGLIHHHKPSLTTRSRATKLLIICPHMVCVCVCLGMGTPMLGHFLPENDNH